MPAEFEGDAAEDKRYEHGDQGSVERGQQHGKGERKCRHQPDAAEHEPRLIAVPHRRHAVHDHVAVRFRRKQRKQDAEAEVKAVHYNIEEHGKGDDDRPYRCEVDGEAHWAAPPTAGTTPAVRVGMSRGGPGSPGRGGCAMSRNR
jgi:hypothetical protein